jgi:hypothetical protein
MTFVTQACRSIGAMPSDNTPSHGLGASSITNDHRRVKVTNLTERRAARARPRDAFGSGERTDRTITIITRDL